MHNTRTSRRRSGFTLVELIIAISVAAVTVTLACTMFIRVAKSVYDTSMRLELNAKIRTFTGRFAKDTIDANAFYVLQNYLALDGNADLTGEDPASEEINVPLPAGTSGDCLLLEYRDDPDDRNAITRLRVYYRDTTSITGHAEVRHVEVDIPDADQNDPLNDVVNAHLGDLATDHASRPTLVGYDVYGVIPSDSTEVHPIFFNHDGRAVSVNFRMETEGTSTGPARRSASAYNFTISPRR